MHDLFIQNIKRLDFDPTDKKFRSVVLVSERNDSTLHPSQIIGLEKADEFKATAVYFRLFPDNRSPIPQIYIYDNSQNLFSDDDLANIHRDLWSNYQIPMFIVVEKTDIKIFDCREPVTVVGEKIKTSPIDTINLASEAIEEFQKLRDYSRKLFDNGIFWEKEKAKGHFLEDRSAYKLLIAELKRFRKSFLENKVLPEETANKLLVFSILIKYLEERGNENDSLVAEDFFKKLEANNFCEVLRQKGKVVALFKELSEKFNGEIFIWKDEVEENLVAKAELNQLADFLDADIDLDTRQGNLWRKYSFNHLPVELISTVYETFLNERKDAVYTPEFLVNTLVDELMPQNEIDESLLKTIDVSCGSGIFLVSVFKRLVQRVRYSNFKETGELTRLKSNELLQIIKDNIFGVDIEEDAVRLTVFSLCLALCDELTPKEIWTELKFDHTFQTNFKHKNFFDYLEGAELGTFDLVIGNAPFVELSVKKDKGEVFYYLDKKEEEVKLNLEISQKLSAKKNIFPQNQLALMFLDQSPHLLKENGLLCLIMPSAPLLYNNSAEFRKQFFTEYQIPQILDFTNLDAVLFGTAKVPAAAVFAKNQKPDEEKPIVHITIRRTKSVDHRMLFEIDKYDFHYVSQECVINDKDKHVWKCNLLGGGRLNNLIERLSHIDSIDKYVKSKKTDGWISGEGYIIGTDKTKTKKVREKATYITGKPTLPPKAFIDNGIDKTLIIKDFTEELFLFPRKKELYEPPVLIIKENIGGDKIPKYFSDTYLTFNQKMVGISSSNPDKEKLLSLCKSFDDNKKTYKLLITATSNEYLVKRATAITKQDIMNLPYSEDKEEMQLSYVEQIICDDVLDYQIELLSKGSKAEVNEDAMTDDLEKYGEVYSKMLNSVYGKSGKKFYLNKIYDWKEYYITEFNYGSESKKVEIEIVDKPSKSVESLIKNELGNSFYLQRIIRINEKDRFSLIKPKSLRYWLGSVAIKDADETFSDSIKAGY